MKEWQTPSDAMGERFQFAANANDWVYEIGSRAISLKACEQWPPQSGCRAYDE